MPLWCVPIDLGHTKGTASMDHALIALTYHCCVYTYSGASLLQMTFAEAVAGTDAHL